MGTVSAVIIFATSWCIIKQIDEKIHVKKKSIHTIDLISSINMNKIFFQFLTVITEFSNIPFLASTRTSPIDMVAWFIVHAKIATTFSAIYSIVSRYTLYVLYKKNIRKLKYINASCDNQIILKKTLVSYNYHCCSHLWYNPDHILRHTGQSLCYNESRLNSDHCSFWHNYSHKCHHHTL